MPSSENEEIEKAWNYIEERFGVEKADLEGFSIKRVAGDYWLISEQVDTKLEVETYGFRFVRITGRGLKPTTYALQFLGDKISKNIVDLDKQEFLDLLNREEMVPREMGDADCFCGEAAESSSSTKCCGKGYVALRFKGQIVGCGYYMNETVSSRIPKGRGKELAGVLE